jgi:hypothetical protein
VNKKRKREIERDRKRLRCEMMMAFGLASFFLFFNKNFILTNWGNEQKIERNEIYLVRLARLVFGSHVRKIN